MVRSSYVKAAAADLRCQNPLNYVPARHESFFFVPFYSRLSLFWHFLYSAQPEQPLQPRFFRRAICSAAAYTDRTINPRAAQSAAPKSAKTMPETDSTEIIHKKAIMCFIIVPPKIFYRTKAFAEFQV